MVFDLVSDPHEEIDLMDSELTYAWVIGIAGGLLGAVAQSAAEYPHISPGADFQGYS
jgi:arylsulfatase